MILVQAAGGVLRLPVSGTPMGHMAHNEIGLLWRSCCLHIPFGESFSFLNNLVIFQVVNFSCRVEVSSHCCSHEGCVCVDLAIRCSMIRFSQGFEISVLFVLDCLLFRRQYDHMGKLPHIQFLVKCCRHQNPSTKDLATDRQATDLTPENSGRPMSSATSLKESRGSASM